jgi:two-component system sensor histidine kinase RegB
VDAAQVLSARMRLRTLVNNRWIAVVGQFVTLVAVYFALGFRFDLVPALAAVALSALLNLFLQYRYRAAKQLTDREASLQLAYDLTQLSALLYLTGGMQNPFSFLLLVPVTVSATVLSRGATLRLLFLAILFSLALVQWHAPLPWGDSQLVFAPLYLWGMWVGLVFSMVFLALYAARVSDEARRRADALTATQAALAREHQLSALGALAAAAAHDLGTPIGSIMLAAKEMTAGDNLPEPLVAELELIYGEAKRCRGILERIARSHADSDSDHFSDMPLEAIVRHVVEPHLYRGKNILIESDSGTGGGSPPVTNRAEIRHGLGNFIDNAVRYANEEVHVRLRSTGTSIEIEISDDGPGFESAVIKELGEPYVFAARSRNPSGPDDETSQGLGLGVFIAKTLIEQTGGRVTFSNNKPGGACVCITWPRDRLVTAS